MNPKSLLCFPRDKAIKKMRKIDNNTRPPKRTRSGKHLFFSVSVCFRQIVCTVCSRTGLWCIVFPPLFQVFLPEHKKTKTFEFFNFLLVELHYFEFTSVLLANITSVNAIGALVKETRSVTMNFFQKKKYFLFKSFVKIKLSKYVQYSWKLHGTVNYVIKTGVFSLVRNYLCPSNYSRQLILNINAVVLIDIIC